MKNWIQKNRIHIFIWVTLVVYLISADRLYYNFFIKNGKPISTNISLPDESIEVLYKFYNLENIQYEGDDLYRLNGWAYSNQTTGEKKYKYIIVLQSKESYYEFYGITGNRINDDNEVEETSLSVLIAKEALKSGQYKIGILIEDLNTSERYFLWAEEYLERTPNFVYFVTPTTLLMQGKPDPEPVLLPKASNNIRYWFDFYGPVKIEGQDLYQITGWSFNEKQIDKQTPVTGKFLVLVSKDQTYSFATSAQTRADVHENYANLNLSEPLGFSTVIDRTKILPADYQVGILHMHGRETPTFTLTNLFINATSERLIFHQ